MLERITIRLPEAPEFNDRLLGLMGRLGTWRGQPLEFTPSNPTYLPCLQIEPTTGLNVVQIEFTLSDGQVTSVPVRNTTGLDRQSPHSYSHIEIRDLAERLRAAGLTLVGLDHLGFNLPWFDPGVHPEIAALRTRLATACLYHRFPSGEAWDFILPGDQEEIGSSKPIDYLLCRKPKFELVSFEKSSTPLIQIDVSTPAGYERMVTLFPEGLADPQIRNVWVYLENPLGIDVCLVLNPHSDGDWSDFFKGCRLGLPPESST